MSAYCADPAFKKLEDKRNVNHIRLIRKLLLTGNIRACVYITGNIRACARELEKAT